MNNQKGSLLIQTLILTGLSVVFITVLVNVGITTLGIASRSLNRSRAFHIAEAGIEYYRWHLAHAPTDFTNGTGQPGPYVLPYTDKEGNQIGTMTLEIIPPIVGSTVVTVRSTGSLTSDPGSERTIEARFGKESVAKFAVFANDEMNFGPGTIVYGPIHSNGGIRFDGIAYNVISSSVADYNDPDHSGQNEFGVHTHVTPVDPLPPASVPDRPDVFKAGRQFPVPAVDFTGLTGTLADLKTQAQASGNYFPSSGAKGYELLLKPNDTIEIYKVQSLKQKPNGCSNEIADNDWGAWSIQSTTTVGTYPFPADGVMFFEDDVWVSGSIDTARITIAVGRFPENPSLQGNITINDNLTYSSYTGTDNIGLIAQNDINVGLYSRDVLRIDAALIAKNGRIGRPYYRAPSSNKNYCGTEALRDTITLYGMLGTNERYGFSWTCGGVYCSGYANRNIIYDSNLLYSPPPSFPLNSSDYKIISWEEIK